LKSMKIFFSAPQKMAVTLSIIVAFIMKLLKRLKRYLVRVSEIQNRGEDFRVYRHEFIS
jgi:hypothetical protein